MRPPCVCILAGGLGTRLGARSDGLPKPLVEVAGRPFLVHQLRLLAAHGIRQAVLCVGFRGAAIEATVGERCEGVEVRYSHDGPELAGTLGAVRLAAPLLGPRFLVMYGDTYLRLDYLDFFRRWSESGLPAGMTVLRNEGRWDRSNAIYDADRVTRYDKFAAGPGMEWIDYGLGALSQEALGEVPADTTDLAHLYRELAARGDLFGYEVTERFFEIGTPTSLAETEEFLAQLPSGRLGQ